MRIDILDIEELACEMVNLNYEEIDADTQTIEEAFYDKYEIELSQFAILMQDLVPRMSFGESTLTDKVYKGFLNNDKNLWLYKTEIK